MQLDHILYQVPELAKGAAAIEAQTGVKPAFGGAHASGGTANYLSSLGDHLYLEILGPAPGHDPKADDDGAYLMRQPAELATFAVRTNDIEALAVRLKAKGVAVQGPMAGGRTTPTGEKLSWKTLLIVDKRFCAFVPFAVQWVSTAHPSMSAPKGLAFTRLEIGHPQAEQLNALYETIGVALRAAHALSPTMGLVLQSPKGEVTLSRKSNPCEGWD